MSSRAATTMIEGRIHHRVEFAETDAVGFVFYPNYYRWFDRGTHEFFRLLGYPVRRMFDQGFATPLAEAKARFRLPLRYDDEIEICSQVVEVRTRAFRIEHQIFRAGDLTAEGYEMRVAVTHPQPAGATLETRALPRDLRALLVDACGFPTESSETA